MEAISEKRRFDALSAPMGAGFRDFEPRGRKAPATAYNAGFEVQRIDALIARFPTFGPALRKLSNRVVDLLPIVRDHVYHPEFNGSFSLKSVLPALVPGLGYDDLAIHDGGTASASLELLLLHSESLTAPAKDDLRTNLLAYCKRDTLAMVRLYERLTELAAKADR